MSRAHRSPAAGAMGQQSALAPSGPAGAPQAPPLDKELLETMRRSMEGELEQRRLAWEQDVVRMQEDFFKVKLADPTDASPPSGGGQLALESGSSPGSGRINSPASLGSPEGSHPSLGNPEFPGDLFRLRFNVRDYDPADINVRAEGRQLVVGAKHMEGEGAHRKITRQFSKKVDIPCNVDIDRLISYLSPDGVLTVEAPQTGGRSPSTTSGSLFSSPAAVIAPSEYTFPSSHSPAVQNVGYESVMKVLSPSVERPAQQSIQFSDLFQAGGGRAGGDGTVALPGVGGPADHVLDTEFGRMLKLQVDMGRGDYRAGDVKVKVYRNRVSVAASRAELQGGRTSRREFQREFELPGPVDMTTLRAVLEPGTGVVHIGASFAANLKHNMVAYLVTQEMPLNGQPCVVEQHF